MLQPESVALDTSHRGLELLVYGSRCFVCSFLRRRLGVTDSFLHLALCLLRAAFGLKSLTASHSADALLDFARCLICQTAGLIACATHRTAPSLMKRSDVRTLANAPAMTLVARGARPRGSIWPSPEAAASINKKLLRLCSSSRHRFR